MFYYNNSLVSQLMSAHVIITVGSFSLSEQTHRTDLSASCPQIPLFNLHQSQNILLPSLRWWTGTRCRTWINRSPTYLYDQELPNYSVDSHQLTCLSSSPQLQSVDKLLVYNQHIVLDKQQTIQSQIQLASEQSLPLEQQTQPNT